MTQDYISWIRSKVGQEKIFLNFSAGILADDQGRVLLQRRGDNGKWGIIGGCMELGETSVDTLKREFFEETGLEVVVKRFLNIYTNYETVYVNGDKAQTVGFVYEVESLNHLQENFSNHETLELNFFSQEEIAELEIAFPQHQDILAEYFQNDFQMGR